MNAHTSGVHKGHLWSFDINAFVQVVCREYLFFFPLLEADSQKLLKAWFLDSKRPAVWCDDGWHLTSLNLFYN